MSVMYACATVGCSERDRALTGEPSFCSICLEDLVPVRGRRQRRRGRLQRMTSSDRRLKLQRNERRGRDVQARAERRHAFVGPRVGRFRHVPAPPTRREREEAANPALLLKRLLGGGR